MNRETDKTTEHLCELARQVIYDIVQSNSAKHGGHIEWEVRTPQSHLQKAARHAITAMAQLDFSEKVKDNEDAEAHIMRVIVRATMALWVLRRSSVRS